MKINIASLFSLLGDIRIGNVVMSVTVGDDAFA